MAVKFHFHTKAPALSNRRSLKHFIPLIFEQEGKKLSELDFIFCDDAYLIDINRTFLNHDFYTDIITFDMSADGSSEISGEIYISVNMVAENSLKYSSKDEIYRVIFHGVLHLCGYDDKQPPAKLEMRNKEQYYLSAFESYLTNK